VNDLPRVGDRHSRAVAESRTITTEPHRVCGRSLFSVAPFFIFVFVCTEKRSYFAFGRWQQACKMIYAAAAATTVVDVS